MPICLTAAASVDRSCQFAGRQSDMRFAATCWHTIYRSRTLTSYAAAGSMRSCICAIISVCACERMAIRSQFQRSRSTIVAHCQLACSLVYGMPRTRSRERSNARRCRCTDANSRRRSADAQVECPMTSTQLEIAPIGERQSLKARAYEALQAGNHGDEHLRRRRRAAARRARSVGALRRLAARRCARRWRSSIRKASSASCRAAASSSCARPRPKSST